MARGCSGSDSEEERHDRFKSERKIAKTEKPTFRSRIPNSLQDYSTKSRSPQRSTKFKSSSYRSDDKWSPARRRDRSLERRHSRERKSHRDTHSHRHASGSTEEKNGKSRIVIIDERRTAEERDRYDEKSRDKRYDTDSRKSEKRDSSEYRRKDKGEKRSHVKDKHSDGVKRPKSQDEHKVKESGEGYKRIDRYSSDISQGSEHNPDADVQLIEDEDEPPVQTLPRYYEIVDECIDSEGSGQRGSRKHKKAKERCHIQEEKKHKDKKHRRKHEKKSSGSDSEAKEKSIPVTSAETRETKSDTLEMSPISDCTESNDDSLLMKTESCRKTESDQEEGELSGSESEQLFGPALPPRKGAKDKMKKKECGGETEEYGPALPPQTGDEGGTPPAALRAESPEPSCEESPAAGSEDEDTIGPLPPGLDCLASATHAELEARAILLKRQLLKKGILQIDEDGLGGDKKGREEWMTELPAARRAQIGLEPRKFRAKAAPVISDKDRSSWTDTPKDKALKKAMGPDEEEEEEIDATKLEIIEKNKEMEKMAKKSEKRDKSLLSLHQKELKKKKKKEEKERSGPIERRPFSREIDLQTSMFDDAQKKSIIKKAQLLDSRFSAGESKFL